MNLGKDGIYTDNGLRLTNFRFNNPLPLFSLENENRLAGVEMQISAPGLTETIVVQVNHPITKQILEAVETARVLVPVNSGALDTYILEQALANTEKKIYLNRFGPIRLCSGEWLFANNELNIECDKYAVALAPSIANIQLIGSPDLARTSIVNMIREIEKHQSTVFPICCYTFLSPFRTEIANLGLATFPILYVHGPQNYGKTTLITEFCLLYDNKETGIVQDRFEGNSTDKGLMQEISGIANRVVLIDDLPRSSDPSITRERLNLIGQIIRFAANNNVRRTASTTTPLQACLAGVAISSEIPLRSASDITRVIQVTVDYPIIGTLHATRADAANAFRAWIKWLLPHFDEEIANLKEKFSNSEGGETARLNASLILLDWVNELFFRFALDLEIVDGEYYESAIKVGHRQFELLLKTQAQEVQRIQSNSPKGNFSWCILKAYNAGEFHTVNSRKKMLDEHDCLIEHGALCIRTKTLLKYFETNTIFDSLSDKKITKTLQEEGAIDCLSKENPQRKRNKEGKSAGKKINGKRYLELNLVKLKKAAVGYK